MRIFFSLLIIIMLQQAVAHAQSSLNFSVGYGLPMGSRLLGYETTYNTTATASTTNQKGVYGSFGAGLNFNATYTLSFSKNFGLDLGATYFSGSSYTNSTTAIYPTFKSAEEDHGSVTGWLVSPQLVLKMEPVKNIQPYAKFGFVLGFVSMTTVYTNTDQNTSPVGTPNITNQTREYTGGLPFGMKGGIGVIFNTSKKTSFFTEVQCTNMSYYPDKADITAYTVNGVDKLSTLPVNQKSVVFKNELNYSSSAPTNPSAPAEAQSSSLPLGNILLNVGVHIKLGKVIP